MLFRTQSAAVYGIDADLVDVEIDLAPARVESDSTSSVTIVGLPDAAVRLVESLQGGYQDCFPVHIVSKHNKKICLTPELTRPARTAFYQGIQR